MTHADATLAALWHRAATSTSAPLALEEIRLQQIGEGAWDLDDLLRHHADDPIDDADEIEMRQAFDDGWTDGCGWEDCLEILRSPEALLKALRSRPDRRNAAELAANGLGPFLDFSVALDDVLRRAKSFSARPRCHVTRACLLVRNHQRQHARRGRRGARDVCRLVG